MANANTAGAKVGAAAGAAGAGGAAQDPGPGEDSIGQNATDMADARGRLTLDKSAAEYQGSGGEALRNQDRENYKSKFGTYPEDDAALVRSVRAERRYGKGK